MKTISVIVPVYNTGAYLEECVASIVSQTYKDLEIILVDDGSTDDSGAICDKLASCNQRVRTYHKPNAGVSEARNYGLDQAKGEYISFCDSDDVVSPDLYQMLVNAMEVHDVDRVVGGYQYLYEGGRTVYCKPRMPDGLYTADQIVRIMIDDGSLSGFLFSGVYNSLFRKSIIEENNLRFDSSIKYNEDSLFSLQYMLGSRSIFSMQSIPTYSYRQHATSATHTRALGDKYAPLRERLVGMGLDEKKTDFQVQMKRRAVTEALWEILDISKYESGYAAINSTRTVLKKEEVRQGLGYIREDRLNRYKRIYYHLMRRGSATLLYLISAKLVPGLSRYISR